MSHVFIIFGVMGLVLGIVGLTSNTIDGELGGMLFILLSLASLALGLYGLGYL